MTKSFIMSILLIFMLHTAVFAEWEAKDYVTYFGTTDQPITVVWNPAENAERYEVELTHVERDSTTSVALANTQNTQVTFSLPRSGHFVPRVRACSDTLELCSDWSYSIDPIVALVNEQSRAWWIYGFVASPGPIIISSNQTIPTSGGK